MPSSPIQSPFTPTRESGDLPASEALAAAAERRTQMASQQPSISQMAAEHEKKQKFRRLVDPGIMRPNNKEQAISSLKTLLKISENLLHEPENPKYRQFKPTNSIIKRDLMDTKGALEYAIELGFRPEVINFQPYYTFNSRYLRDLHIGASIIGEFVNLENEKAERAARSKLSEKAAIEAAANKVKLAYLDDRKTKMLRDEMERERRAAAQADELTPREDLPSTGRRSSSASANSSSMPGSGHILGLPDGPPPYNTDDGKKEDSS